MNNDLEKRIRAIEERNKSVASDKAWETSWTRKICITGLTYIVAASYLLVIDNNDPFLNALVPTGGYLLSNLVLKSARKIKEKI